jgi:DNA-binding transcriptional MerR regulator
MVDDGLTAGAVARRLGVAVTTLRTWHQRYDLGPSSHEPGKHRRYSQQDVARLELMQRLTADGVPPGEAARWVRERPITPPPPARRLRRSTLPDAGAGRRDGGGLPMGATSPAARGLARAAMRLDAETLRHIATGAVAQLGVVGAWDTVLRPVLRAIGERHGRTGGMIEVEHLVSSCTSDVLGAVPRPRPRPSGRGRVLLACADEEQHSLPIEALSAALAQAGVVCRMLGARVPPGALRAAVQRTGPAAVLVWSHLSDTAAVEQLTTLVGNSTRPLVLAAAGPGWQPDALPASIAVPRTLGEAVDLMRSAVS